ncbi:MAG: TraR/DksA C4-type zinc finger protein [Micrococcales bacterium]|nr:TraR/DksA C4-type zinc finger protein [Micrococcales bacterium]
MTFAWQSAEGSRAEYTRELAELDRADRRADAGAFGGCAVCGRPIPVAQLQLRPARTECVSCADRPGRR